MGTTPTWTEDRPQPWARAVAWGVLACAIPSALWRVLMLAGLMPGTEQLRQLHENEPGYVIGLSLAQVAAAVLVVGLVRPWGERFVGVPINRWVPVALGTLGGLAMTWLFTIQLFFGILGGDRPDQGTVHGIHLTIMFAVYAPMVLFGPLTLAAVVGYARRRRIGRPRLAVAQRAT